MVGSVCAFYCYTYTLNLLCKHTRLVSVCAFNSYTCTLNLLCKHTRLVSVGMFEGYAYTLNLLCIRLYFVMYAPLFHYVYVFAFCPHAFSFPALCIAMSRRALPFLPACVLRHGSADAAWRFV